MSRDMDTDDGAQTHSRRALLKLSGAATTGLVAPGVGAADAGEFDWDRYETALAERYPAAEAAAVTGIVQRYTDGQRRLTEAELTAINEEIVQHSETPQYTADIEAYRADTAQDPSAESIGYEALSEAGGTAFELLPGSGETYGWDGSTLFEDVNLGVGVTYGYAEAGVGQHDAVVGAELIGEADAWASVASEAIKPDSGPGEYTVSIDWKLDGYIEGTGEAYLQIREEGWAGGRQRDEYTGAWETFAAFSTPETHYPSGRYTDTITIPGTYNTRLGIRLLTTAQGTRPCYTGGYPPEPCVGNQSMFSDYAPEEFRDQTDTEKNGFRFSEITVKPE